MLKKRRYTLLKLSGKLFVALGCLFFAMCFGMNAKAQAPVAQFTSDVTTGCAPVIVNFTDLSTNGPTSWFWDFGNGVTSTLQNPTATFFNPGVFTVVLTATNASGSNTVTKTNYIVISDKPVVDFSASDTSGCTDFTVQFTDLSTPVTGTITNWLWDFGDGNTSNQSNPVHTYTNVGNYTVTLRVTNSANCFNVTSKIQYIEIVDGVHADFSNSTSTDCRPPATIRFTNTTTGPGTISWQWFFGDGGTSTAQNPSYTYLTPGTYTVTLIGTSSTGCSDTIIKNNLVVVQNVVSAMNVPDSVCVNTPVNFVNGTNPLPPTATWYFGDGNAQTGVNTTYAYTATGTYQLKLVNQYATCSDSVIKTITVLPRPTASFNGTNLIACKPPLTVNFTDASTGAVSWQWFFGDGNTSNLQNPSHTYTGYGLLDVTLVITSSSGCTDTFRRPQYVNIAAPVLALNNVPAEGCTPFTLTPDATITTVDGIASYFWDFGDGFTSTLPNPSHTYNTEGTYTFELIVTTNGGCIDSVVVLNGVHVGDPPTVNFSASPLVVCAYQPVQFTDLSSPNVDEWLWDFGDGGTSTAQNPVYNYNDSGLFTVELIVTNNGCERRLTRPLYIRVLPPIADFRDSTDCNARLTKYFIDRSRGALTHFWDFGDGNTSTNPNPSHTYASTGTYTVSLTVTNGSCSHTYQRTVRVIIETAAFNVNSTIQCRRGPLTFTATGSNPANIASYAWNFGDGNTGSGQSVTHNYTTAGNYTVTLTITDLNGCTDAATRSNLIRINGPAADFASTSNNGCKGQTVTFNDLSATDGVNAINQWTWDFGDGNVQTFAAPPFTHTYINPGSYNVQLVVRDASGCFDTLTRSSFVNLSNLEAWFTSADSSSCPGSTVNFRDSSTGAGGRIMTWDWNLGNGFTSNQQNPSTSYPAIGQYDVTLIVTDSLGCRDSITRPAYISIDLPFAFFTMTDSIGSCPPLEVQFNFASSYYRSVSWDFGDGNTSTLLNPQHVYSIPGNYTATLTITSPGGCTSTFSRPIRLGGPYGSITYTPLAGCKPFDVVFRATTNGTTSSILWDFNNGFTFNTTDTVVFYTYPAGGRFVPRAIMSDPSGCLVPVLGRDTIIVEDLFIDFEALDRNYCDTGVVQFRNLSTSYSPVTYEWDFGDGNTSNAKDPLHTYNQPGFYTVKLKVISPYGCLDSLERAGYIKVDAVPTVDIYGDTSACVPANIQLQAIIAVGDTSTMTWYWRFDNGDTSTMQTLDLVYNTPGDYGVTLIGTNFNGCVDSVRRMIRIHPLPVVNAGRDTTICTGSSAQLQASGAFTYFWLPPSDGTLSCNNCPNPVATPAADTMYIVRGRTIFGCESDDTLYVKVIQPPNLDIQPANPEICNGGFVQLTASGAQRYTWTPATGLNNANIYNPRARPVTTTTYTVTGTDTLSCFSQTRSVTVTVLPLPVVNAGPDQTIPGGGSATMNVTGNFGITGYVWRPANSLNCDNCPSVIATPKATTNYVVWATNSVGCVATDTVTIFVVCNSQNFFVPNTFSPNGDGMNDVFFPRGKGIERIRSMIIYNRWGERVFEKREFPVNDASAGWNGLVNGQKASSDVYTYFIEIVCENNLIIPYKGNVTLIN